MIPVADWLSPAVQGLTFTNLGDGGLWIANLAAWLPPAAVGLTFTLMGALKLFGFSKGIVGGHEKPFVVQLCGT
jgi:hypothetical protein